MAILLKSSVQDKNDPDWNDFRFGEQHFSQILNKNCSLSSSAPTVIIQRSNSHVNGLLRNFLGRPETTLYRKTTDAQNYIYFSIFPRRSTIKATHNSKDLLKICAPTPCMDKKPFNSFIELLSMLHVDKATNKMKELDID